MKHVILIYLIMLFFSSTTYSRILVVNNTPGAPTGSNYFTTVQSAIDYLPPTLPDKDTIYIIGSSLPYSSFSINRMVVIVGPGYFLSENIDLQSNLSPAIIDGTITVNSNAEGAVVLGLFLKRSIVISSDNVVIMRNRSEASRVCVTIESNVANILINQNYLWNNYGLDNAINIYSNVQNVLIMNNFIGGNGGNIVGNSESTSIIQNNVMDGGLKVYNSTIENNILREGNYIGNNNLVRNNICNSSQFGTLNGNKSNVVMSNVFIGQTDGVSTDGQWQLKPEPNPAIGAGVNGIDCGMFGGTEPYVLSGIPPIPSIYYFEAASVGSDADGLPVHIKVRSNN